MKKSVSMYNVWTDGSYRDESGNIGAGWIVRHNGGEVRGSELSRLEILKEKPHGSDIAEVWAVCRALENIPRGAAVQLHIDCQNVVDWLKARDITAKSKKEMETLALLFSYVVGQSDSFESFEVKHVKDRRNLNMGEVHKLSREASTPGGARKQQKAMAYSG